jgi:hypothetical protein
MCFALGKLGAAMEKTATWQLREEGIDLSDPSLDKIDLPRAYLVMKETMGGGADFVIREAWKYFLENSTSRQKNEAAD